MKTFLLFFSSIALSACLGDTNQNTDSEIDKLKVLDTKLAEPMPGEWLHVHSEKGQSFEEYLKFNPVRPTEDRNKIYLQPIGTFSEDHTNVIQFTADYLTIFFGLEVLILPRLEDTIVPDSARRYQGSTNEQLLTTSILNYLQKNIPKDALVIMAVTSKDLYPGAKYNFVFGQARTRERVGVSSIYRYTTDPIDSFNHSVCLERLIKTSSHEIGHMLSCLHCTYGVCVMNGSNSLPESDSRPNRLCSQCLRKLQWNLGFDVNLRLKKIGDYFSKHDLKRDHQLTTRDLQAME